MYPSIIEVHKPIWLALKEKEGEAIEWTPNKPKFDNGMIEAGTILHFSHIYQGCGNYKPYGEFNLSDIASLIASNSISVHN